MDQAVDIRGQEPREVRREEVHHDEALWQTARQGQDRVHVIVRGARPELSLRQTDSDLFQIRRHDQSASAR